MSFKGLAEFIGEFHLANCPEAGPAALAEKPDGMLYENRPG